MTDTSKTFNVSDNNYHRPILYGLARKLFDENTADTGRFTPKISFNQGCEFSYRQVINRNMPRKPSVDNYYSMTPLQIAEVVGHEGIEILMMAHCEKSNMSIATRMI
jgi:hypothetical protein